MNKEIISKKDLYIIIIIFVFVFTIFSMICVFVNTQSKIEKRIADNFCNYAVESNLVNLEQYSIKKEINMETIEFYNLTTEEICQDIYIKYLLYMNEYIEVNKIEKN